MLVKKDKTKMKIIFFITIDASSQIMCSNLFFLGHVSVNGWRSSFLGLAAVNLAESAGKLISIDILAKIYVSAAIQIRTSFPEGLHFIAVSLASFTLVSVRTNIQRWLTTSSTCMFIPCA